MNIVTGQYDLIISTPGTVNWVEKLVNSVWDDIAPEAIDEKRDVININHVRQGYYKKHKLLTFYTVLNAGHSIISHNRIAMEYILEEIIRVDKKRKRADSDSTPANYLEILSAAMK